LKVVKTKAKTSTSKTKTLFFVLETPRDQDFGLEDYITADWWPKFGRAKIADWWSEMRRLRSLIGNCNFDC